MIDQWVNSQAYNNSKVIRLSVSGKDVRLEIANEDYVELESVEMNIEQARGLLKKLEWIIIGAEIEGTE